MRYVSAAIVSRVLCSESTSDASLREARREAHVHLGAAERTVADNFAGNSLADVIAVVSAVHRARSPEARLLTRALERTAALLGTEAALRLVPNEYLRLAFRLRRVPDWVVSNLLRSDPRLHWSSAWCDDSSLVENSCITLELL